MKEYFEMTCSSGFEQAPEWSVLPSRSCGAKRTSSTTKIRAVFDVSARSSTSASLNKTFLVGPTIHPSLVDVLLWFHAHITWHSPQMYQRCNWIGDQILGTQCRTMVWPAWHLGYRFLRSKYVPARECEGFCSWIPSCGQSSSSVDDGITGSDSVDDAINLQCNLQELFSWGKFLLRKWNSSHEVLDHIPPSKGLGV